VALFVIDVDDVILAYIYRSTSLRYLKYTKKEATRRHGATLIFILVAPAWSKRGNINTAALVTIAQCNTLFARCSRQLIGPADWVVVTLGPLRCD